MEKPNFGESQLQYCVNAEISNAIHEGTGFLISPIIPTLRDEYLEAWDSGFAFPWIMPGPNPDHHGANFFIQYKLSGQLGKKGKEYPRWNKPYFRFTIPHQIKNGNKYQDDYHQWDKLKELANTGYATFYATNHVLRRDELFELSSQKQLLNSIPFLDVSLVNQRHKNVSFLSNSQHFFLHSELEEVARSSWELAFGKVNRTTKRSLGEDNAKTFEILQKSLSELRGAQDFLNLYKEHDSMATRTPRIRSVKFHLLRFAFYKFFDVILFRV